METGPAQLAEAWKVFFVTAAGASATLVGLVIVAISVNLHRILEQPQLPSHGGATVAALVLILVTNMAQLIPQSGAALAIEISVFGFLAWQLQLWSARQSMLAYLQSRRPLHESVIAIAIGLRSSEMVRQSTRYKRLHEGWYAGPGGGPGYSTEADKFSSDPCLQCIVAPISVNLQGSNHLPTLLQGFGGCVITIYQLEHPDRRFELLAG